MELLKHECGIAMVRLRKPLAYYQEKYGSWMYGLNKLYLLMEKQHNRGQEGAGLAVVKKKAFPGDEYLFRERAEGSNAISEIFDAVFDNFQKLSPEELADAKFAEERLPFAGESYIGHLRYSTTGRSGLSFVHPMVRRSNWRAKCLSICGNFNLTNVDGIFDEITSVGQHPRSLSDTHILLEQIGHRLDREVERLFREGKKEKGLQGMDVTNYIEDRIDISNVLRRSSPLWDGGYVMCGLTGSSESFVLRDPWGIRPAFYYISDEIVVVASERPVIQTVMNLKAEDICELLPGQALIVNQNDEPKLDQILEPKRYQACSFERIYFSRGSDKDIYCERKALGSQLVPRILEAVDHELDKSVFSFVPNTAEVAYYGMIDGLEAYLNEQKSLAIQSLSNPTVEEINNILNRRVRTEKVAIKDIKLRTFISEGKTRDDLAAHVYDVTYGTVTPHVDNLVVIDDSIVRGTTLRQSIISIMDRLEPKRIVIVSSSPQIRYPDYYGIDMRHMREFIAFRAAVELLKEHGLESILHTAYNEALELRNTARALEVKNVVKAIYEPFSAEQISQKIIELLTPSYVKAEVKVVYQDIEGLHKAIPDHPGDWYFTGNYPTPGGAHLVNEAFISYMEEDYKK